MESLQDILTKRMSKSLISFLKLVDPEHRYKVTLEMGNTWNRLTLIDQRKLYLYLLYRKWRGIEIFGDPVFIMCNCHPVPFNWNGVAGIDSLLESNKLVIAKYNGSFGSYTKDEVKLYEMTDVKPLTF